MRSRQCHRIGHIGAVGRYVHQRRAIGDAIIGGAFLPDPGSRHRVSSMLGIGRFGAISGAWAGATLLGLGWNFEQVLTILVVPAALATIAIVIKGLVSHADAT